MPTPHASVPRACPPRPGSKHLEVPFNTSTPLIYVLKKKTQVTGVDMFWPENHNRHVQHQNAQTEVQLS